MSSRSVLPSAGKKDRRQGDFLGTDRQRVVTDYAAQAEDWYLEPTWVTELLLRHVDIDGPTWDPCCGQGNIIEALHRERKAGKWGLGIRASDIVDRGCKGAEAPVDFLKSTDWTYNIVFNPPYARAEAFILHALELADGIVAAVVNLKFLASQGRRSRLFEPHPPAAVLVLSRRPSMPPGGSNIEAKEGTADYCWLVWGSRETRDSPDRKPPVMGWLA